jgi:hypothetical protein
MAGGSAAVKLMASFPVALLLSTAFVACEDEWEGGPPFVYRSCVVEWRGTLATGSSAFNVQACWNGRCTSNITVQVPEGDAGVAAEYADAGCVPTTPGGLPSHCNSVPFTPGPGCELAQVGNDFSVLACARGGSDGTDFDILLTPTISSLPDDGDQFSLTIQTPAGTPLVEATGNVPRNGLAPEGTASCQGALFDLSGARIGE